MSHATTPVLGVGRGGEIEDGEIGERGPSPAHALSPCTKTAAEDRGGVEWQQPTTVASSHVVLQLG